MDAVPRWRVREAVDDDAEALAHLRWTWRTGERREVGMDRPAFVVVFARWFHDHRQESAGVLEIDVRSRRARSEAPAGA